MERSYTLNLIEDEQYKSLVNTLPKDQKVQDLTVKYYLEFKRHQSSIQSDKISLYLKCAYYLAQKSQWITNINGQRVRNAGLSLNQLLKKHTLQEIMITLKQYSKRISLQDPETLGQLQGLIKQISFLITFYNKFQKVLLKLELKQKNKQYSQILSELVWLLYIEAKNKILSRSLQLIDNTCMLAHTLCFVLIYSWDYHQPGYFTKGQTNLQKITSRKQVNARIHQKILELFLIKNIQSYKNVAERFQAYFSFLKKINIIRMTQGKQNFLSPEFLFNNYKRLDQFYQKKLDFNHLDQRIFFKDRTANITPSKFTPFARQKINGAIKKLGGNIGGGLTDRPSQQNNYTSHRILNYEHMQAQVQDIPLADVSPQEIKFPKNIIQTPSSMNTPLIQQTPYTAGITMYNYVNDHSSQFRKKKLPSRQSDQFVFQIIDKVLIDYLKEQNVKARQIKRNHIFSLYKWVAQQFWNLYTFDLENEDIIKSILLISMEIVFFVSNIQMSFQKLQNLLGICQISLWRSIDYFLKFDKTMPANIKVHLLDLEVEIISEKIWKNSDTIAKIQNFLSNQKFQSKEQQTIYQRLCKRILHQIAFQILNLCRNTFQNKQQQQKVSQITFDIMKQVLLVHPYMIWNNHFDQIVMCSVFSVCRVYKLPVKFQNIRQAYLLSNLHLPDQKKLDMFTNIEYETEQNQSDNNNNKGIIGFYNSCFLIVMNQFVKTKCQQYENHGSAMTSRQPSQRTLQQKDMNTLLQSPLNGIIPKEVGYGIKKINPLQNNKIPQQMQIKSNTPRLQVYTQSPLLKNELISIKAPVNSKKALNYDQNQKINSMNDTIKNKKDPVNQPRQLYQQNSQTNNFLSRKFTTTKPVRLGPQNPCSTSLIKSPCNNTKSPRGQNSPSPRVMNDTLVKQNSSNSHNIYLTKRQFNGKALNVHR